MEEVLSLKGAGVKELGATEMEGITGGAMDPATVILAGIAIGIALYQVYDADDCP